MQIAFIIAAIVFSLIALWLVISLLVDDSNKRDAIITTALKPKDGGRFVGSQDKIGIR